MAQGMKLLALVAILALASQLGAATLFPNFARDMARNQILHILRHHPDLIYEIVKLQQQQQQQQQQQMQMQMQQLNGQMGNQMNDMLPGQQLPGGNSLVMNGNTNGAQVSHESQMPQNNQGQQQQQLSLNELVRQTGRFPNQRFVH